MCRHGVRFVAVSLRQGPPNPSKTGFAKNPSPTRAISDGKSILKGGSPPEKECPPSAPTLSGQKPNLNVQSNEVFDDDKDS
jgi:hypothetical protein